MRQTTVGLGHLARYVRFAVLECQERGVIRAIADHASRYEGVSVAHMTATFFAPVREEANLRR